MIEVDIERREMPRAITPGRGGSRLRQVYFEKKGETTDIELGDLETAVIEGAVNRVRPKVMTICAILFGLLPIMWAPAMQAGADVMKRIAAPMIGGVITSGILELLLYPVIYVFWRKRHLCRESVEADKRQSAAAEKPASQ